MTTDFDPIEWVTTQEAADLTGYSKDYFRKAVSRGILRGIKRGRDWFFCKAEVIAYHEEMQRLGTAKHNPGRKRDEDGAG